LTIARIVLVPSLTLIRPDFPMIVLITPINELLLSTKIIVIFRQIELKGTNLIFHAGRYYKF
jgi:hypothetical protein